MEILVEVLDVELKDSRRFELRCTAEAADETLTLISSNVESPFLGKVGKWPPKFEFKFHSSFSHAALLFIAAPHDSEASSYGEHSASELGSCLIPLTLALNQDGTPPEFGSLSPSSLTKKTGILCANIEGTDIAKFVGKIRFNVTWCSSNAPPASVFSSESSWIQLKTIQDRLLASQELTHTPDNPELIVRAAKDVCFDSLPTNIPTVAVIFHSLSSVLPNLSALLALRPIACLGNSSNIRNDDIFQMQVQSNQSTVSILKPVTLKCGSGDHLEVHVLDDKKNCPVFSASHRLSSLQPFKHYNWQYNSQWTHGDTNFPATNSFRSSGEPNVVTSVVYRPSMADFTQYEGLELLIKDIELEQRFTEHNIIVCSQLISCDSKARIEFGNGVDPPFKSGANKKQRVNSTQNCNVAVFQFTTTSSEPNNRAPVYFFFPKDPFFLQSKSGVILTLSVYAANPSSVQPWWQTTAIASGKIDVPSGLRTSLKQKRYDYGVSWELSSDEIAQPEEMLVRNVHGVLRWKSTEMKFISPSIDALFGGIPHLAELEYFMDDEENVNDTFPLPGNLTPLISLDQHSPSQSVENMVDYHQAFTQMGQDIIKLREQNALLHEENSELRKKTTLSLGTSQRHLESASREDLIRAITEMSKSLTSETQAREASQSKVQALQGKLAEKSQLEARYLVLEEAHTAQQKLVQQLQSKVGKYRKCCNVCKQQEAIITQLESLLSHKTAGQNDTGLSTSQADHALEEKDKKIRSLQSELAAMAERVYTLERNKGTVPSLDQTACTLQLQQKLMTAEAQANALASKLQSASSKLTEEKAQYEHQISKYKDQVSTLRHELTSIRNRDSELRTIVPLLDQPLLDQPSTSHQGGVPKPADKLISF